MAADLPPDPHTTSQVATARDMRPQSMKAANAKNARQEVKSSRRHQAALASSLA